MNVVRSEIKLFLIKPPEQFVPVVAVVLVLLALQADLVLGGGRHHHQALRHLIGRHLELLLLVVGVQAVGENVRDPVGGTEGPGAAVGVGHAEVSLQVAAFSSWGGAATKITVIILFVVLFVMLILFVKLCAGEPRPGLQYLLGVRDEDGAVPGVTARLPALRQEGPGEPQRVRDPSVRVQALSGLHWTSRVEI